MPNNEIRVNVSVWTIAKVILVSLGFYLVFFIRDILALLFIVLIFVAAFDPIINKWEQKIRRGPAVALLFVAIMLVFAAIIYIIVPPVISQLSQLINQLPEIAQRFRDAEKYVPSIEKNLSSISQYLTDITGGFVSVTAGVFGGVFSLLTAMVITAYMLLDKNALSQFAVSIMPDENRHKISALLKKIGQKLGGWLRGQILLGVIIGI
jgi:predicted PurR-regulated permease PerM